MRLFTPRVLMAAAAAALIGLASVATEASARPGGGGFRGGGGFHGGAFRAGGAFRGGVIGRPAFRAGLVGGPRFRHLGHRRFLYGAAFPLYYAGYSSYYDDCVVPRRIWTPYGWRIRLVNVCGYY